MKPVLLTTHTKQSNNYTKEWFDRERAAYKVAGFELETIDQRFLMGMALHDDDHFAGRDVFIRCYANEEASLERIVRKAGGNPIIPNMDNANNWYRNITWGVKWFGREISHSDMKQFGYLEYDYQKKALRKHLELIFDYFSRDGKVFFKSSTKQNLQPAVRTLDEAYEDISYSLSMAIHHQMDTLIFQNPIEVESNTDGFGREEYRVYIVNDKVSTVSLFTDNQKSRDYTRVIAYAESFAKTFCNFLPLGYCLDVAITAQNEMVVIELNGIGASGFYADHDINKLFKDIKDIHNGNA